MSYPHLNTFERARIETLHLLGHSTRQIARQTGRHHSTIARELCRKTNEGFYRAEEAQQNYEQRRENSKPHGKADRILLTKIEEKLRLTWSPEQIAHTTTLGKVSCKTIYNWLYQGKLSLDEQILRHKGLRRRPPEKRGKVKIGFSILDRPAEVENRQSFGHWELDSMVSSRGKSKGCLASFLERKSRLYTALKMPDRSCESMQKAIEYLRAVLPLKAFKTATVDRGKEFACHNIIKDKLGITLYFADPYCSWQRGSNENANGLLREFYPKKTDFSLVHEHDLRHTLFLINSRPRKCLGWKSPIQIFLHEVSHLT